MRWKLKKGDCNVQDQKWAETNYKKKRDWKEKETKYNRLELTSDPVFVGLEKLQRYVTKTILYKKKLISLRRSPNSNWLYTWGACHYKGIVHVYICKLVYQEFQPSR